MRNLWKPVLAAVPSLPPNRKKLTFQNIVKDVIGEDDEESDAMFLDIQGNLSGLIEVPAEDEEEEKRAGTAHPDRYRFCPLRQRTFRGTDRRN